MYPNRYGAASPPINNPFVTDPTNARSRYPDISSTGSPGYNPSYSPTPSQFSQWAGQSSLGGAGGINYASGLNGNGHNPFQTSGFLQQQPTQSQFQQQPQQQFVSPTATGLPFQPSRQVGGGSSYGYLTGQQPQQTGYFPAQQQLQTPGYATVASLDPYSSIGQGWDGSNIQQQQQQQQQQPQRALSPTSFGIAQQQQQQQQHHVTTSKSATGELHPREYIRTHKAEVESWDTYAWKQLLGCFDSLKHVWERRRDELKVLVEQAKLQESQYAAAGYFTVQFQQEGARLQGLVKDAEANFDSVAASTFQMKEVFQGYRQSADLASKKRVREATNAALQSLPDWPGSIY
ncbi:hypothetical protein BDN72DRAFT_869285 [Pluteus cervinus]|uniref:Uncharacterized protein n=1 Tax=Pluteus cervinus TaxID=181527 RepID=A0ACD3B512_9AGAR|nr:hypothetical protein BDN72DRAFT_869285 [Pluteus cervinus]